MFSALGGSSPSKKLLFGLALALVVCTSVVDIALAQIEIETSSLSYSSDCILHSGSGLRNVYVRLAFNSGSSAARFRMELGPGVTMTYVSESSPYSSLGYALAGISICFDACLTGDPLIDTVTFMSYGTDTPYSEVRIVPHPSAQTVEVEKCDGSTVAAYGGRLEIISPGIPPLNCPTPRLFPGTPLPFDCAPPVSVENTTWGLIKALYRN